MKIPLNWLRSYIDLPDNLEKLTQQLTMAGHLLDKVEKVNGETVIDLELRGNRADCYSILGIAREVKALFGNDVRSPEKHPKLLKVSQLKEIPIKISSHNVHRIMAVVIRDVKLKPSPDWLKKRLENYDVPTVNNIVDLTNYVMVETGEPMHAFDLSHVRPKITIRQAKKGEKMTTFEGTEITVVEDDLVWTREDVLLSIAGAIGSKEHSILPETQDILIEAATYDQANIRRSVRRHHLLTEAGLRHEKDLDPNLVAPAIYRYLYLIKENNWGTIEPRVFDYYPKPVKEKQISLNFDNLEKVGGIRPSSEVVKNIFQRLNMSLKKETTTGITVSVPTYRTDVSQEADLIEEVLRIYGYEKIPEKILSLEIPADSTPDNVNQENDLRQTLVGLGFDEVIGTSFVSPRYQLQNNLIGDSDSTPPASETKSVSTANPPSPEFEHLQLSLSPNLFQVTQKTIDRGGEKASFFEIGKIYYRQLSKFFEPRKLGLTFWQKSGGKPESFLAFKGYLEALLRRLNLNFHFYPALTPPYSFDIGIKDKKIAYGNLGPSNIFFAQFDLDSLLEHKTNPSTFLWPKFPATTDDLTFILKPKTPVGKLIELARETNPLVTRVELVTTYKNTRTLRVTYQSPEKTLTSAEVEKIRKKIISSVEKRLGAKLKGRK